MNVFDLYAKLSLDSSAYESGLNKAKSLAGTIGGGIASAAKVGLAAVTAAGTAMVGFGATAVKTGMDFAKSMSQVAATMGKSMDEMANETEKAVITVNGQTKEFEGTLRDFAQEMGRNTVFSATQAADALNYMALAGYDTEKSMAMLPNVLNLAAAGNMDLARASDMVTDTETAFGISTERTSQMVDEMAKAASTGNTSVEQLGDAFLTVGGLAKELNGGFVQLSGGGSVLVDGTQELEIALTAMANAGIKGSEAGTHMRNMLLKLSSPTEAGTKQLAALGVKVFDSEGKMRSLKDVMGDLNGAMSNLTQEEKLQAISDLFNTRDTASAEALLAAVGQDWDKIGESILDAQVPLEDVKKAFKEAGVDVTKIHSEFEGGFLPAEDLDKFAADVRMVMTTLGLEGEEAAAKLSAEWGISFSDALKAVNATQTALNETTGAAQKMADTQLDNLAGDITLFKSALEGAKIAISDVITGGNKNEGLRGFVTLGTEGIQKVTEAFKEGGLTGAMEAFGTVLSDALNMILGKLPDFVDGGIKLLGALGQGLMDNLDVLIEAGITIVGQLSEAFITGLPKVIDAGLQIVEALMEAIDKNMDKIMDGALRLIDGLINAFSKHGGKILSLGMSIVQKLFDGLIKNLPKIMTFVTQMVTKIAAWIGQNSSKIIQGAVQLIQTLADGFMKNLPIVINAAVEMIMAIVKALTEPSTLTGIINAAIGIVTSLADALISALPNLIPAAIEAVISIAMALIDNVDKLVEAAIELMIAFAQGILDALPKLIEKIPEIIVKIVEALVNNVGKLIEGAIQLVVEIVKHLPEIIAALIKAIPEIIAAILSAFGPIGEGLIGLFSKAWEGIKNVFKGIGGWFSEKFGEAKEKASQAWEGITDFMQRNREATDKAYEKVGEWFEGKFKEAKERASKAWEGITDFMQKNREATDKAYEKIDEWFEGKFKDAKEKASAAWDKIKESSEKTWEKLQGVYEKADTWFEDKFGDAKEAAVKAWDNIKEGMQKVRENAESAWDNVTGWFGDTFGDAKDNAIKAWDNVKERFDEVWENIKSAFDLSAALDWGRDMIQNFVDGIKEKWDTLKRSVEEVASTVKEFLGFSEPEKGPLSNFHTFAPDMMKLFADGIKNNIGMVTDAVNDTAFAINNDFETASMGGSAMAATSSSSLESKVNRMLEMMEQYMPQYTTAEDMEHMTFSVNNREFGRLVREVG